MQSQKVCALIGASLVERSSRAAGVDRVLKSISRDCESAMPWAMANTPGSHKKAEPGMLGSPPLSGSNAAEILEPSVQEIEFASIDQLKIDQRLIAFYHICLDCLDPGFKFQGVKGAGNLCVVEIAGNFVGKVAQKIVFVSFLVNRGSVE